MIKIKSVESSSAVSLLGASMRCETGWEELKISQYNYCFIMCSLYIWARHDAIPKPHSQPMF